MKIFSAIFLFIWHPVSCELNNSGINNLLENLNTNSELYEAAACIRLLFRKIFNSGPSQTGQILSATFASEITLIEEIVLNEIFNDNDYNWSTMLTVITEADSSDDDDSEYTENVKNYLTFVKSSDEIADIIEEWKATSTWNPLAQFAVYLNFEESESFEEAAGEIMEEFLDNKIFNLNILMPKYEENKIELLSFYPYDKDNCAESVPSDLAVNSCVYTKNEDSGMVEVSEEIEVEDKERIPTNLHKCPLKVKARTWEPYTFYDDERDGFVAGIDVMMVLMIVEKLNMTLMIFPQNTSMYHVYQNLIENSIDIIIGGVDEDPSISDLISSSTPYYQDDMTWCVQRAGRLFQWMSFLTLFDSFTWSLLLITVTGTSFFIFYVRNSSNEFIDYSITFIGIIAVIIGQSPNIFSLKTSVRFLLCFIFSFALIINTAYQSFLISFLTHPEMEYQITTAQEIFQHQMDVTGGIEVVAHLNREGTVFEYLKKKIMICHDIEECVKKVSVDKNLGIAVSREHVFYNPNFPRDKLFCFAQSETVYSYLVSLLVPKNFHLLEYFNHVIQLVIESGHVVKWTRELKNDVLLSEELNKEEVLDLTLRVYQVQGPFVVGGFMISGALCVFMMELIVHKMAKKSKSQFWRVFNSYFYSRNTQYKETC